MRGHAPESRVSLLPYGDSGKMKEFGCSVAPCSCCFSPQSFRFSLTRNLPPQTHLRTMRSFHSFRIRPGSIPPCPSGSGTANWRAQKFRNRSAVWSTSTFTALFCMLATACRRRIFPKTGFVPLAPGSKKPSAADSNSISSTNITGLPARSAISGWPAIIKAKFWPTIPTSACRAWRTRNRSFTARSPSPCRRFRSCRLFWWRVGWAADESIANLCARLTCPADPPRCNGPRPRAIGSSWNFISSLPWVSMAAWST